MACAFWGLNLSLYQMKMEIDAILNLVYLHRHMLHVSSVVLPERVISSISVILVFIRGGLVSRLFLLHLPAERFCCAAAPRLSRRRLSGDRGSPFVLHRSPFASVAHVRDYNETNRHIVSLIFVPFDISALKRGGRGASSHPRCASVAQ